MLLKAIETRRSLNHSGSVFHHLQEFATKVLEQERLLIFLKGWREVDKNHRKLGFEANQFWMQNYCSDEVDKNHIEEVIESIAKVCKSLRQKSLK